MIRMLRATLVFAACAWPMVTVAAPPSSATSPTAAQSQRIAIPFRPPLDTPMRYRIVGTQNLRSGPQITTLEMTVTFAARSHGLLATIAYQLPASLATDPNVAILRIPMTFELSADGQVQRLHDLDGWQDRSEAFVRTITGAEGVRLRAMIEAMLAQMREQTTEAQAEQYAMNLVPLVEFGGLDMRIGETRTVDIDVEAPIIGAMVQRWATRLESAVPQEATFTQRMSIPPEAMAAAIERLRALMPSAGANRPGESGSGGGQDRTYIVSRDTGLTKSYVSETFSSSAQGTRRVSARTEITRLDEPD